MTRRKLARYRRAVSRAVRRYKREGNLCPPRDGGDTLQSLRAYLLATPHVKQSRVFAFTWG